MRRLPHLFQSARVRMSNLIRICADVSFSISCAFAQQSISCASAQHSVLHAAHLRSTDSQLLRTCVGSFLFYILNAVRLSPPNTLCLCASHHQLVHRIMSQSSNGIDAAVTHTPERTKRLPGTQQKSPHVSSGLSPAKKSTKSLSANDVASPSHLDFNIPQSIQEIQNLEHRSGRFSPLSLSGDVVLANNPDDIHLPEDMPPDALSILDDVAPHCANNVPDPDPSRPRHISLSLSRSIEQHLPTYQLIQNGIMWIPSVRELGSDDPKCLSEEERLAVESASGILRNYCPVWKTFRENSDRQFLKHNREFEYVYTAFCKCKNCDYRIKICRFVGGLLALEKCVIKNGIKIPICHNNDAHSTFFEQNGGSTSLNHAQKEHIVKMYRPSGDNDTFTESMLENPSIPPSLNQVNNQNLF